MLGSESPKRYRMLYICMLVIFFSIRMLGSADLYVINVINNEDPKRYRMLYVYV